MLTALCRSDMAELCFIVNLFFLAEPFLPPV
jgi:hypothetical protein